MEAQHLSVIQAGLVGDVIALVNDSAAPPLRLADIPDHDKEAFELLASGGTLGLEGFDSPGAASALQMVRPRSLHELAGVFVLYSPELMRHIHAYSKGEYEITEDNGGEFPSDESMRIALRGYALAWLKAHHRPEFFAALLNRADQTGPECERLVAAIRADGTDLLPPDVQLSEVKSTADGAAVRCGLAMVNGVPRAIGNRVAKARNSTGAFRSIEDFVDRVQLGSADSRVVSVLVDSGACDAFGADRDALIRLLRPKAPDDPPRRLVAVDEPSSREAVLCEVEALGIALAPSAIECFALVRDVAGGSSIGSLEQQSAERHTVVIGQLRNLRFVDTGCGEQMAFGTLHDETGTALIAVFTDAVEPNRSALREGELVIVDGLANYTSQARLRLIPKFVQRLPWGEIYEKLGPPPWRDRVAGP